MLIWMLCDASDWVLIYSMRTQDLIIYEVGIEGVPRDRKEIFRRTHESWATWNLKRLVDKSPHLRLVTFDSSSDAVIIWALGIAFWYHLDSGKLEVIYYKPRCHVFSIWLRSKYFLSRDAWFHWRTLDGIVAYMTPEIPKGLFYLHRPAALLVAVDVKPVKRVERAQVLERDNLLSYTV